MVCSAPKGLNSVAASGRRCRSPEHDNAPQGGEALWPDQQRLWDVL
jgi:hypothetical protein